MNKSKLTGLATMACVGAMTVGLSVPAHSQSSRPDRERPNRTAERMQEKAEKYANQEEGASEKVAFKAPGTITWTANKSDRPEEKAHHGSFEKWNFTKVSIPDGDITKGEVALVIDITTLKSDSEKLTGHLLSSDFFTSEKFPKAMFTIKEPKPVEGKEKTYEAKGKLTLMGITQSMPVTFVVLEESPLKIKGTATVLRDHFNIGVGDYSEESSNIWNAVPVTFETVVSEALVPKMMLEASGEARPARPAVRPGAASRPASRPVQ